MGKSDYAEPKAYRPITLSSFLLKVLERIVQWYLLERVIPPTLPHQHAYTRGLSCEMALSTIRCEIKQQKILWATKTMSFGLVDVLTKTLFGL